MYLALHVYRSQEWHSLSCAQVTLIVGCCRMQQDMDQFILDRWPTVTYVIRPQIHWPRDLDLWPIRPPAAGRCLQELQTTGQIVELSTTRQIQKQPPARQIHELPVFRRPTAWQRVNQLQLARWQAGRSGGHRCPITGEQGRGWPIGWQQVRGSPAVQPQVAGQAPSRGSATVSVKRPAGHPRHHEEAADRDQSPQRTEKNGAAEGTALLRRGDGWKEEGRDGGMRGGRDEGREGSFCDAWKRCFVSFLLMHS